MFSKYVPKNVLSTKKICSNYYAHLHRVQLAKESTCAPMRFEYVLLSIMSGDDLRRTLGDANNRITRISNSELGQILAVNRENQQEAV